MIITKLTLQQVSFLTTSNGGQMPKYSNLKEAYSLLQPGEGFKASPCPAAHDTDGTVNGCKVVATLRSWARKVNLPMPLFRHDATGLNIIRPKEGA